MNPLYDNHCRYRTILTIEQPDYRKDIRVLYGTPGPGGKDLLGLKGHAELIEIGRENKGSNVVKKDLFRQQELLHRWKELEDISGIVHHPHEYSKNKDVKDLIIEEEKENSGSSDDENVSNFEGKRYHKFRNAPINSHVWAVLVMEEDHGDNDQSKYTVVHKELAPANEL